MKTVVSHETESSGVPFLKGILIRSLLDAGLGFEQAMDLATEVREDLAGKDSVDSDEIRALVVARLETLGLEDALEIYGAQGTAPAPIEVHSLSGTSSPFSRGRHARYLQSSGMRADKAEQVTNLVYDQLLAAGVTSMSTCQLGYITWLCLGQEVSKKAARRYLVWSEFQRSARPLLLMICGTVGSGKSTIAAEIAHLLEIVRIQSTDMLREVMRMMMPKNLLPVIHSSSFDAWQCIPVKESVVPDRDAMVAAGYQSQAELLAVPCEAVLQRAIEESVPMILEGVHARQELLGKLPEDSDAIPVHVTLAVLKRKELKARLRGRGVEVPQRRAKRYLNKIESIWRLQSYLLSEADRHDSPIITNRDKEKATQQIILHINHQLSRYFDGSPADIFGEVAERWEAQFRCEAFQSLIPELVQQ